MPNFTNTLMHHQALASFLELLVNKAISMDANGEKAIKKLTDKSITLVLEELSTALMFTVSNGKVLVLSPPLSETIDEDECVIKTSIRTLIQLKNEQQLTQLIKEDKLDISGDIKNAQHFASFAESLDIDWQSELDKHFTDIGSYKITEIAKGIARKVNFAKSQIEADATEWLVHEKRLIVTSSQISTFNENVTLVSEHAIAIESRIEQLFTRFNLLSQPKGNS